MPDSNLATSPAASGDAKTGSESDNISNGQAAAVLFKKSAETKAAATADNVPAEQAAENAAPAQEEPVAESAETNSVETQAQETEPAEEATAGQEEESEENVLSNRAIDEKTKQRIQKRIDKEVGRRKQLEGRLNELESLLREKEQNIQQTQTAPQVIPQDNVPPNIAAIQTTEGLADMKRNAKIAIRWAEEKLDAINDGEPAPEGWDRKTLKESLRQAKIALEDHIPQREQFLQEREKTRQQARQLFPFLTDRTMPEYQQAQAALREPWLQNNPNAEWIVGVQIEGLSSLKAKAERAKAKAEDKPKPKLPPAKPASDQVAVTSTGATNRAPGTQQKTALQAERSRLEAKGSVTTAEAAELLKKSEQLRNR